jgi:hypothetical protein
MNWTVVNVSGDTVSITDTPIPVTWEPGAIQTVPAAYFLASAQLSQAVANQQLCIVGWGAYAPLPRWAPLTYVLLGTGSVGSLTPVTLTQSGVTGPLTLAPYTQGTLLLNLTAVGASGASLAVSCEAWDGQTYYPAQAVIAATSAPGPILQAWVPPAPAARFVWTVTGSVTATALYQLMP